MKELIKNYSANTKMDNIGPLETRGDKKPETRNH